MSTMTLPRSQSEEARANASAAALAFEHGAYDEAVARAGTALALNPKDPGSLQVLALVDAARGEPAAAVALLARAVRLAPGVAQYHYNLAGTLQQVGEGREAMLEYVATLRLEATHQGALWNYGNLLRLDERFDAALTHFERLRALSPDYPGLTLATAITLFGLRRLEEAERWFRLAAKYEADDSVVWWEMSHCLLTQGKYDEGFDCYERRFESAAKNGMCCYPFPFPRWSGQPLARHSILVHGEQGLGDEIMFANMLPELIEEAERVVIVTSPALHRLFAQSFPQAQVIAQARLRDNAWLEQPPSWLAKLGNLDYQVPIGSLAAVRRRTVDAFPTRANYLTSDSARVARWRSDLDAMAPYSVGVSGSLRVGLMWGANPSLYEVNGGRRAPKKSVPAHLLEPLAGLENCLFVSLQNRDAAHEAANAPGLDLVDCHREIIDLADTAALIESLDCVISVDTSVLHLAGALGKPAIGLLAWDCDFRWGHSAGQTPWYPTMRLLRQRTAGDWGPVIEAARLELEAFRTEHEAKKTSRTKQ
ncbi:MAG: tetratricopeptide repeat-containing glycosyltransferase family protein [Burkholderiales bacterium]